MAWCQPRSQIGIDADGAYLCRREEQIRLHFVRVNAVQLIAKRVSEETIWHRIWPQFYLIYRDQLKGEEYALLRSFAAQDRLLRGRKA
ncbi:hypothetical protein [Marinomonas sp. TW1]|uniref:hypothetical protein n=1 Tax=Marinomonas sp. TW1 TaxID=1561203 RepID=UPI0012E90FF7|nr:hypothetical protein [Marinomonas sp. TW1]